jgi:tetratricopeptide (TPR) repeat protein
MRLTRTQWTIGIITLLTAVLAIVTNLATFDIPATLEPYLWLSWPVLVVLIVLLVVASIHSAEDNSTLLSNEDDIDRLVRKVSEVEQITSIDPILENADDWADKLSEWEKIGKELACISGADNSIIDKKLRHFRDQPARLLMRLVVAIEPALSQRGHWNELIRLASSAYMVALALENWIYTTHMAYVVAQKLYYLEQLSESQRWIGRMADSLERVSTEPDRSELKLMFLELKGIVIRDFRGEKEEARTCLEEALLLSVQIENSYKTAQILAHLGKLSELNSQIEEAIDLYEQALASASQQANPDLELDCYDKLARLAFVQGHYDDAYTWYGHQLDLAKESLRVFYEGRAHEGIAWVFLKKERFKEGYRHARQALAIEEQITGPRVDALRHLAITIADKELVRGDISSERATS